MSSQPSCLKLSHQIIKDLTGRSLAECRPYLTSIKQQLKAKQNRSAFNLTQSGFDQLMRDLDEERVAIMLSEFKDILKDIISGYSYFFSLIKSLSSPQHRAKRHALLAVSGSVMTQVINTDFRNESSRRPLQVGWPLLVGCKKQDIIYNELNKDEIAILNKSIHTHLLERSGLFSCLSPEQQERALLALTDKTKEVISSGEKPLLATLLKSTKSEAERNAIFKAAHHILVAHIISNSLYAEERFKNLSKQLNEPQQAILRDQLNRHGLEDLLPKLTPDLKKWVLQRLDNPKATEDLLFGHWVPVLLAYVNEPEQRHTLFDIIKTHFINIEFLTRDCELGHLITFLHQEERLEVIGLLGSDLEQLIPDAFYREQFVTSIHEDACRKEIEEERKTRTDYLKRIQNAVSDPRLLASGRGGTKDGHSLDSGASEGNTL